jgi:DNA polymerase-3 subunit epsilon
MPVMAYDTETTGLVKTKLPPSDPSQPRIVQLAAQVWSDDGTRILHGFSWIIRPDGWEVPREAADVHGITTEMAFAFGVPIRVALASLCQALKVSTRSVAHNHDFDLKMIASEFHRAGIAMPTMNSVCTKTLASPITRLPPTDRMVRAGFGHKFKDPTLSECVRFLFGEELSGAHDALVDTAGCARVYFELVKRGAITAP